jgi:hypothetical protein
MLSTPSPDDLIRLLKAWRFWFAGAMLGALAGAAVYWAAPPPFRARATVNVDFHLEQAWPQNTDREQFYYLEREVRKLQEIAASDAVLGVVETAVPGVAIEQMRAGKLQLSQPGNGGWHFFADDTDPHRAAALASAWASAFARQVEEQRTSASGGLEPFVTASGVQVDQLAAGRAVPQAVYLLAGAALMLVVAALGVLFVGTNP